MRISSSTVTASGVARLKRRLKKRPKKCALYMVRVGVRVAWVKAGINAI